MKTLTDIAKRAIRPLQLGAIVLIGFCLHALLPKEPSVEEWVAYGLCYVAWLAHGMDNYREGLERGIKIMEKMQ
jgi:hypothetical protein